MCKEDQTIAGSFLGDARRAADTVRRDLGVNFVHALWKDVGILVSIFILEVSRNSHPDIEHRQRCLASLSIGRSRLQSQYRTPLRVSYHS